MEMNVVNLTELEKQVFDACYESSNGNGHDFGYVSDAKKSGITSKQLSGVMSSLNKKDLLFSEIPDRGLPDIFTIKPAGHRFMGDEEEALYRES